MEVFIIMFSERRVETQKAPAGDLLGRGSLNEECEPPGRVAVRPQSRMRRSGEGRGRGWDRAMIHCHRLEVRKCLRWSLVYSTQS